MNINKIEIKQEPQKPIKPKIPFLYIGIGIVIIVIFFSILLISKGHTNSKNKKIKAEKLTKKVVPSNNEEATKKVATKQPKIQKQNSSQEVGGNKKGAEQYIVKKGDTLSGIAKKYYGHGYYYKHLADTNKITNPDLIYPGTKIEVPIKNNNNKKIEKESKKTPGN